MFSRIIALLLLFALSPLLLIIALIIWIDDGRPIFFKQKRVGINYTFFWMYKFRTMKSQTPELATHLLENPQRYLLKSGRVIRKLSLDELPNLINIFKGDMRFVGPRPALYNQDDLMQLRIEAGVDKLMPGLTGWAQVNGRDEMTLEKKVEYEKYYLEHQSLLFDLKILLKTFSSVLCVRTVKH